MNTVPKMTLVAIRELLKAHKNERGISNWKRNGNKSWGTYGLGLTQLKKIAKQIQKDRGLARELRQQPNYDMKILSFLVDEPKNIPLEETKRTVLKMEMWSVSHVYIQNIFSKLPYAMELAGIYRSSTKEIERRCGYGYLYYAAKNKKIPDAYFIPIINSIAGKLQSEENFVKDAMNNALLALGQRSTSLHELVLATADIIGKVTVDYGDNSCVAPDVRKQLKTATVLKKIKLA